MSGSVMTPQHPRWQEFCERLEGCDFQEDENERITWRCAGGRDKSHATAILETMEGVDVPASLAYFDEHGGHCDCEILFNVENHAD